MSRRFALLSASIAMVTACGQAPVRQDVEFLRGCWVWKEPVTGRVLGFLRLLPPEPDAASYDGQVQVVEGQTPELRSRFSFKRDGSAVTWTAAGERVPSGTYLGRLHDEPPAESHVAVFQLPGEPGAVLQVEGDGDRLSIWSTDLRTDSSFLEFEGERDGCD